MSAGLGILHSEANHSPDIPVHLLQIWIMPDEQGIAPKYQQVHFASDKRHNQLCLVASRTGANGSITLAQDASIMVSNLDNGASLDYAIGQSRNLWLQLAKGNATINGMEAAEGDGITIQDERQLSLTASTDCSLILFDMGR